MRCERNAGSLVGGSIPKSRIDMASATFFAKTRASAGLVVISFYRETPGGWKLDLRDEFGKCLFNGDRWVETLDDLVLQIGNFTDEDLTWQSLEGAQPVSFYSAVRRCVLETVTTR